MNPQIKSMLAGVAFGIWPFLLSSSGLRGNFSSFIYGAVALICIVPFAMAGNNAANISNANWNMAIGAGILGATGLLLFNGALAQSTEQSRGTVFILMIVIQTAVAVAYDIVMNGGLTFQKFMGFALAIASVVLMMKK